MPDPVEDVLRQQWRFAALNTFVTLDCAELLGDRPQTTKKLAMACRADPNLLSRVLRTLAAAGVVDDAGGRWTLTTAGDRLRADHPDSQRTAVLVAARPEFSFALAALPRSVRTGTTAFIERYGSLYDLLRHDRELGALFNAYMDDRSRPFARVLPEAFDFTTRDTVVDVGGGKGHIIGGVLRAHPHLRGIVLDLPHVVPSAEDHLAGQDIDGRYEVVSGDFFHAVPTADTYIMSNIVHNLDDADAVRVLEVVRRAAKPPATLLCLEMVLPDDGSSHLGWDLDMRMASLFGQGQERTRGEYTRLLEQAGFRVDRISPLPYWHSLITAHAQNLS